MILCMVRQWIVVDQVSWIGVKGLCICGYVRVLAEWFKDIVGSILGQHELDFSHAHLLCWLCIR